jgi:hypothetical protein
MNFSQGKELQRKTNPMDRKISEQLEQMIIDLNAF